MLDLKVSIRPFETTGIRQCFRCQRFQHSSFNCHFAARCVKCAGPHLSSGCPHSRDDPPKCCNCGGAHTANYSGCSARPQPKGKSRNSKTRSKPRPGPPSRNVADPAAATPEAGTSALPTVTDSALPTDPPRTKVSATPSSSRKVSKKMKRKSAAAGGKSETPVVVDDSTGVAPSIEPQVVPQVVSHGCQCHEQTAKLETKVEEMTQLYAHLVQQVATLCNTVATLTAKLSAPEKT